MQKEEGLLTIVWCFLKAKKPWKISIFNFGNMVIICNFDKGIDQGMFRVEAILLQMKLRIEGKEMEEKNEEV